MIVTRIINYKKSKNVNYKCSKSDIERYRRIYRILFSNKDSNGFYDNDLLFEYKED